MPKIHDRPGTPGAYTPDRRPLGGFKVQGKGCDAGLRLLDDAKRIEEAGFFREEADALFEVLKSREIR